MKSTTELRHQAPCGTQFYCATSDLSTPIQVTLPENASLSDLMEDLSDFMTWHALCIFPELKSFTGYSGLKFEFDNGTPVMLHSVRGIDALAQAIRTVDGNHQLGAGALAEKVVEHLS